MSGAGRLATQGHGPPEPRLTRPPPERIGVAGPRHVHSVEQFEPAFLRDLFAQTDKYGAALDGASEADRAALPRVLGEHRSVGLIFYTPSTRTRFSFTRAAHCLGARTEWTENAEEFSSAIKGEDPRDTAIVLSQYGYDALVVRHGVTGTVAAMATVSATPVINAGDGNGEHPTQALLDYYTIWQRFGAADRRAIRVTFVGDLKYGRTVRSLALLLGKCRGAMLDPEITFVSPDQLRIGDDIKQRLSSYGVRWRETDSLSAGLAGADVVYVTRTQSERVQEALPADVHEGRAFSLTAASLAQLGAHSIVLHPLPRRQEIAREVDADPRALYLTRQVRNGLLVRMALLEWVCRGAFATRLGDYAR